MSRRPLPAPARAATRLVPLGLAAALPVVLSGCNLFMIAAYLIAGPPSVEPDFEAATRASLTDEDVTVAVVCYVPLELRADMGNETLDRDLARLVAQKLTLNKIKVRDPNVVAQWLARNPDYEDASEVAEAMQVTHVVYLDLSRFSLWEENSATLLRGRADTLVSVWAAEEVGDEAYEVYGKEVATPPNAIVFGSGRVSMAAMAGRGAAMNLLAAGAVTALTLTWVVRVL